MDRLFWDLQGNRAVGRVGGGVLGSTVLVGDPDRASGSRADREGFQKGGGVLRNSRGYYVTE